MSVVLNVKQLDKKVQRPAIGGAGHHVTVAALHGIGGLIVTWLLPTSRNISLV